MSNRSVHFLSRLACGLLVLSLVLVMVGCDEETIGPQRQGSIEGLVQDAKTDDPIANANVTTSPPTQSVLTDENGAFAIEDVPTSAYSIDVTKSDYKSRSVQVKVQENKTTTVTILLEREDDFRPKTDSLTAQVTNWYNDRVNRDSTGADSIFVDVEYSARNVGDVPIRRYELYFDIHTTEGAFSREVSGDSLDVGQRDIGGFRKYITAEAQGVQVEDIYWSTNSD